MGMQVDVQDSEHAMGKSENFGQFAVLLISLGSILVVMCAAFVVYRLRRRREVPATFTGVCSPSKTSSQNPTDFMNSLATWDRSECISDSLENRRRSAWNLEMFENYGPNDSKDNSQFGFAT